MPRASSIFSTLLLIVVSETFQFGILPVSRRVSPSLYSSKEDEIRELEERLAQLKQQVPVESEESSVVLEEEESVDIDPEVYTELLSEKWKEGEEKSDGGGSLSTILAGIGFLAFLAIFSQIPVGQEDLSRFSGSTPTQTIDLGDLNSAQQNSNDLI